MGRPFMLHGDTAWSLLAQLKREDVDRYLEDRHRRGFNTILVNLIEHKYAANAPRNAYGEPPFLEHGNFDRPNEKYFVHVDWVLQRAADLGMLVLLTPSYLGFQGNDEGWYSEMLDTGDERLRAYGRYLGARYRNMHHVIWMDGGDYNAPNRRPIQAIIDGIRETDPDALHSFHAARGTAAREFLGDRVPWLNLNTIYTDENSVVGAARTEYTESLLPFVLVEARYEGEGASEAVVRAQAYQAMLSGACGQLMGNKPLWLFDPGWQLALDSPGTRSMAILRPTLETLQWWRLRPAPDSFIADGAGTGVQRAAAALFDDRHRAVIYVPGPRDIVINSRILVGSKITARWIDPASGQFEVITGSPLPSSERMPFRASARNSSGFGDWLLVLDAAR